MQESPPTLKKDTEGTSSSSWESLRPPEFLVGSGDEESEMEGRSGKYSFSSFLRGFLVGICVIFLLDSVLLSRNYQMGITGLTCRVISGYLGNNSPASHLAASGQKTCSCHLKH